MTPKVTIRKALSEPQLLGTALAGDSWQAWRTLLIAAMGEPLDDAERETFTKLTGRESEPLERVEELTAVVGRRGGKSRAMATLACYVAALCNHEALVNGEVGVVLCIAPDQKQASIVLEYAAATLQASELLAPLIQQRTMDAIELTNGIRIEVRSSSFRRLRGPTYVAVICDEVAFLYSDEFSSNADVEILNAVRPGLATTNGPLILCSSPYAKRGVLWDAYKQNFRPDGDPLLLVAQGESRAFNPSLPQRVVDRALQRDEASARAEYLAQFRSDIETFISIETIDAVTIRSRRELPPASNIAYAAFTDPSGGSSDSFALSIGHMSKGEIAVLDVLREIRAPFSPEAAVEEFSALLKVYRCHKVVGDHYAGEWPKERFKTCGVVYETADRSKSDLYKDALSVLNSGRCELLDIPRLANQFTSLERRTARSGKDSIDHPPQGRDDLSNAVAGLLVLLSQKKAHPRFTQADVAAIRARGQMRAMMGFPQLQRGERAEAQRRRARAFE